MRFERREHRPLALIILTPLLAVAAALALSGILIAAAGAPVLEAYWRILVGAFGSRLSATETLTRATPLMLTGLAAAVAFRARVWNIGGEGQFYLGAIAVAAVGSQLFGQRAWLPVHAVAVDHRCRRRHDFADHSAVAEAQVLRR